MLADGRYDRLFSRYHDDAIRQLGLKHRTIIRIINPEVGPEPPRRDDKFWFDPDTYRPAR